LYNSVSQAYAGFLPIKTVGVVGDNRRYAYTIVLRAVKTIDYMTARPYEFPEGFLEEVSTKIVNQIESVSRVLYDITSKPPGT
jgi:GMP synthase (glutamine-hydrolysing)